MAVHTADNWLGEEEEPSREEPSKEEPSKEEPSKEEPRGEQSPVEAGREQCKAVRRKEGELFGTGELGSSLALGKLGSSLS